MPRKEIKQTKAPAFKGLFNTSAPNLSQRFQYGLEAIDEQSILVVTSDEHLSNKQLEMSSDKISIPIMKKYTLLVKKGELDNRDVLESNFAIFKKDNNYYILSLADHPLRNMRVDFPNDNYNKDNIIKCGDTGYILHTGEFVSSSSGEKEKFVFYHPKKFNTVNAIKYLDVKYINNIEEFNRRTIASLNTPPIRKNRK